MVGGKRTFSTLKRWSILWLFLIALALLLWWGFFRTVQMVQTEPVRRGSIENAVTALGVLQPQRYVDVGAQVSGQIKRIAIKPGDKVGKGDLLLEIDPAIQQATVQTDESRLLIDKQS